MALFGKKHRRSPSHSNLRYGRSEGSSPESPEKDVTSSLSAAVPPAAGVGSREGWEVDPLLQGEFLSWRQQPTLEGEQAFLARVLREDVEPCLEFPNEQLGQRLKAAVRESSVFVESVGSGAGAPFPRRCALLQCPRLCPFRLRLPDDDAWHYISLLPRNRIAAVCDFLNYLRYIQSGLVKSSAHEVYWEIIRLRREMTLARLGISETPGVT